MFKPSLEVYEDKGLILMIHFQKEGEKGFNMELHCKLEEYDIEILKIRTGILEFLGYTIKERGISGDKTHYVIKIFSEKEKKDILSELYNIMINIQH